MDVIEEITIELASPEARFNSYKINNPNFILEQETLIRIAEQIGVKKDMNIAQGFFPLMVDKVDVEQLYYLGFLMNDAVNILTYIFPQYSNVINEIKSRTILLFLSDESRYDSNDWRHTESTDSYTDGNTTLFAISGQRNSYLRFHAKGYDYDWEKKFRFDDYYMDNLLAMIEELFHAVCMNTLGTTPEKSGTVYESYTKHLATVDIYKDKNRNNLNKPFALDDALLEGLAAYLRYKVVDLLINEWSLDREAPDLAKAAGRVLSTNHYNFNAYRNYLKNSDGTTLTQKSIQRKVKNEKYYMYIYGIELVSVLYDLGWDLSRTFTLLTAIRSKIGALELENASFSLAPNSKYQKVKQQILQLAV